MWVFRFLCTVRTQLDMENGMWFVILSLSLSPLLPPTHQPRGTHRDVVQAMQDPNAGLKLHEMKAKGARQTTRYFTGKELLDWLITWSFASDRSEASSMATQMLRYGFFHPVRLDREEGVCVKLRKDSVLDNDIADTEDATYIFVSA